MIAADANGAFADPLKIELGPASDKDVGSMPGQLARNALTDASAAAGHHRNLAV